MSLLLFAATSRRHSDFSIRCCSAIWFPQEHGQIRANNHDIACEMKRQPNRRNRVQTARPNHRAYAIMQDTPEAEWSKESFDNPGAQ